MSLLTNNSPSYIFCQQYTKCCGFQECLFTDRICIVVFTVALSQSEDLDLFPMLSQAKHFNNDIHHYSRLVISNRGNAESEMQTIPNSFSGN